MCLPSSLARSVLSLFPEEGGLLVVDSGRLLPFPEEALASWLLSSWLFH